MAVALAVAHTLGGAHPLARLAALAPPPILAFSLISGFQLSVAAVWGLLVLPLVEQGAAGPSALALAARLRSLTPRSPPRRWSPITSARWRRPGVANLLAVPLAGLLRWVAWLPRCWGWRGPVPGRLSQPGAAGAAAVGRAGCAQLPGGHWWVAPSAVGVTLGYLLLALLPACAAIILLCWPARCRAWWPARWCCCLAGG